jgi:hypothetical protein
MPLTDEGLEAILTADGWPFERLDATTWRTGFRAPGREAVRVFLRLAEDWLYLTIVEFLALPDDPGAEYTLLRRLMELNREITLAKFATERREVVLTVELPTQDLAATQVRDGLDALSFYASRYHDELVALVSPAPTSLLIAAAGRPVSGNTVGFGELERAIGDGRVLRADRLSSMGDGYSYYRFATEADLIAARSYGWTFLVFPRPIPEGLRQSYGADDWDSISDVLTAFHVDPGAAG